MTAKRAHRNRKPSKACKTRTLSPDELEQLRAERDADHSDGPKWSPSMSEDEIAALEAEAKKVADKVFPKPMTRRALNAAAATSRHGTRNPHGDQRWLDFCSAHGIRGLDAKAQRCIRNGTTPGRALQKVMFAHPILWAEWKKNGGTHRQFSGKRRAGMQRYLQTPDAKTDDGVTVAERQPTTQDRATKFLTRIRAEEADKK